MHTNPMKQFLKKFAILGAMGIFCLCNSSFNLTEDYYLKSCSQKISKSFEKHLNTSIQTPNSSLLKSYFEVKKDVIIKNSPKRILCVDLGGTNLKICIASLKVNDGQPPEISITEEKAAYRIPHSPEITQSQTIYKWIAEQIKTFQTGLKEKQIPLPHKGALTFSFPLENVGNKVVVTKYTKNVCWSKEGLLNPEAEAPLDELNAQVSELLQTNLEFEVVINDSMATLLTGMYENGNTGLGMVLGTGVNCSYFEPKDDVAEFLCPRSSAMEGNPALRSANTAQAPKAVLILNTECGGFCDRTIEELYREKIAGPNGIPEEDKEYLTEKMVGGLYFQEWVNNVFKSYIQKELKETDDEENESWAKGLKNLVVRNEDMENQATLFKIFSQVLGSDNITSANMCVEMFTSVYRKCQKIQEWVLAGIISACISKDYKGNPRKKEFYVCLNGSGWNNRNMVERVRDKVFEIITARKEVPLARKEDLVMSVNNDASLIGAYVAFLQHVQ
ncbi:hexokinase [Nematocida sp. AWRm77]|nr:hexokinase [Nematocida sp. AWRm77]